MAWVTRLGELDLLIRLLLFWTGSNSRKQGRVFCSPVQEGERMGGSTACVHLCPMESQLEMHHLLNLLHLLKPLTSQDHIPVGYFTRRNSETGLICVAWALFLDWKWFTFLKSLLCICVRKGWTSPFLWRPSKIKGCLCYIYVLIAKPCCH